MLGRPNMMRFVVVSLLFLLLSARNARAEDIIPIGWIGPLTGNAAVLGVDSAEAARLAVQQYNEKAPPGRAKLQLLVEDDQYVAAKTVTAYRKLVSESHARVLIVVTYSGLFALAPLAEQDGVLLLDPLDCNEEIAKLPENTFCISQLTEYIGYKNAEYAVKNNLVPAAVISYANDAFMGTLADATARRFRELGHPVTVQEAYLANSADFKAIVLKIKKSRARSVFFYGYDELGIGMKEARAISLEAQFFATVTMLSEGFLASAGGASEGTVVSVWRAPRNERLESFLADFRALTGRAPTLEISTIPTYDILNIIGSYVKDDATNALVTGDVRDLRRALYHVRDYTGVSGSISIDPDGATRSLQVDTYRFEKGELKPLGAQAK